MSRFSSERGCATQTAFCLTGGYSPEPADGTIQGKTKIMEKLSPMMQYLEIKKSTQGRNFFFTASAIFTRCSSMMPPRVPELDLTLTGKQPRPWRSAPPRVAACPSTATKGYAARLIAKGYKVAICEQTEDPAKAKGLVKRDIRAGHPRDRSLKAVCVQGTTATTNIGQLCTPEGQKRRGLCYIADVSTSSCTYPYLNLLWNIQDY